MSIERRKRRSFNGEYKAEAVRLVREGGKSVAQVAKDLDLTDSALRNWVKQAEVDEGKGPAGALTTAEREELTSMLWESLGARIVNVGNVNFPVAPKQGR